MYISCPTFSEEEYRKKYPTYKRVYSFETLYGLKNVTLYLGRGFTYTELFDNFKEFCDYILSHNIKLKFLNDIFSLEKYEVLKELKKYMKKIRKFIN